MVSVSNKRVRRRRNELRTQYIAPVSSVMLGVYPQHQQINDKLVYPLENGLSKCNAFSVSLAMSWCNFATISFCPDRKRRLYYPKPGVAMGHLTWYESHLFLCQGSLSVLHCIERRGQSLGEPPIGTHRTPLIFIPGVEDWCLRFTRSTGCVSASNSPLAMLGSPSGFNAEAPIESRRCQSLGCGK